MKNKLPTDKNTPFLDDFERALKQGQVDVAYGRVMFIGAAGVGKSTLLGALMNQPLNQATSTIMADTRVVKCPWKRVGPEQDAHWCDVSGKDEVIELAVLSRKAGFISDQQSSTATKVFDPNATLPNSDNSDNHNSHSHNSDCHNSESHNSDSHSSDSRNSDSHNIDSHNSGSGNSDSHNSGSHTSASSTSFEVEVRTTLSEITAAARSHMSVPPEPTADLYLNVWDCGGQRVYLDVLPAFLTSRTIFFLMFNASKGLQESVSDIWNNDGKSTPLKTLHLSGEDFLIQWMSCIHASLSDTAKKFHTLLHPLSDGVTVPPFPGIVVIGTHGDKPGIDEQNMKSKVKSSYMQKPYGDQVVDILILDSTKRGNEEHPAIAELKRIVRKFVSEALCFPTPIAWVLFRKMVSKVTKSRPIISLDNIKVISKACSIDDTTLLSVLSFYHELGAFLHYGNIDNLKDKVIVQPEWLVKHIGKILAPKDSLKNPVGPQGAWRLLQEKGILVEPLYQAVWKTSNTECDVKPQAIADLLEHFFLIAKIEQKIQFPNHIDYLGKKYFMPCALSSYGVMKTPKKSENAAAPLHLTFESKYVPPGYFVRLATVLSRSEGFSMDYTFEMYSDWITFQYGDDGAKGRLDDVTISANNISIVVNIVHQSPRECFEIVSFRSTCRSIFKLLHQVVVHDLRRWFKSIKVKYGFQSECNKDHFFNMNIDTVESTPLLCTLTNERKLPTKEQQYWLKTPATTCMVCSVMLSCLLE